MKVSEVMTRNVVLASPDQTIGEAAEMMAALDAGALPISENDKMVGVITDRDIAIRAVAQRLSPDTPIREIMTSQVLYCYDDEETDNVVQNMSKNKVRRLPVVNREKRLVGIVSFGDLSREVSSRKAGDAIAEISKPGGAHSQAAH
jgi:CBS domain-containing protein